jgi:four helix bundle protein
MKWENVTDEKSFEYGIRMVRTRQYLVDNRRESAPFKQLLKRGTSVGTNVSEASGAISESDLSRNISTACKDCRETKYRIRLLGRTGFLTKKGHKASRRCRRACENIILYIKDDNNQ